MNGEPDYVSGHIANVTFDGASPNSGEMEIDLEPIHKAFFVFMDTPREVYFEMFKIACSAMWDRKDVEIEYRVNGGDKVVTRIRAI